MELPYIIAFGIFIVVIVGFIVWLVKDYKQEKEIQQKMNGKDKP
jgi:hypothetical protein